jgi:hypothetical protein
MYFMFFAAMADAEEAVERGDCKAAAKILADAQKKAEEIYISESSG